MGIQRTGRCLIDDSIPDVNAIRISVNVSDCSWARKALCAPPHIGETLAELRLFVARHRISLFRKLWKAWRDGEGQSDHGW